MEGVVLPVRVLPGLYLGTEVVAASLPAMRLLNITTVLNVGLPQCPCHFANDPFITYCALQLFDNAASNFSAEFLHSAFPFVSQCLSQGKNVLVHCKTGLSKGPAIVAGVLMLRYNLPLMEALEKVVESGQKVKISDHLLGELLLLSDSRHDVEMTHYELPMEDDKADEGKEEAEERKREEKALALLANGDLTGLAEMSAHYPMVVRRCVWQQPPKQFAVEKMGEFCSFHRRFESAVSRDVYACVQRASVDVGAILADALHAAVVKDDESALTDILYVLDLYRNYASFAASFEELSKARFLDYFYRDEEEKKMERLVTNAFASVSELKRLERSLVLMLDDLQSNVKPMGEGGRVLLAPKTVWSNAEDGSEVKCNIPEALASFPIPVSDAGKKVHVMRHLGSVHAKFGKVTIAMPTDVFCVLEVFNHLDEPTREELFEMCGADRLDVILSTLLRPLPRAKKALILRDESERYRINPDFDSRVRMLEIKL